eukprot:5759889-Amphidinium_carterae.1
MAKRLLSAWGASELPPGGVDEEEEEAIVPSSDDEEAEEVDRHNTTGAHIDIDIPTLHMLGM